MEWPSRWGAGQVIGAVRLRRLLGQELLDFVFLEIV
jgi:hypothetical protein